MLKNIDVPYRFEKLRYVFLRHKKTIFRSLASRLFFKAQTFVNSFFYSFLFNKKDLSDIFCQPYQFIDFSCGKIQWEGTLLQRYRQVSTTFSSLGGLVFSGSLPHVDRIKYLKKESQNLIVVNPFINPLMKDIERLLTSQTKPVLVRVQSTDFSISYEQMLHWQQLGFIILYEYIDPFHEEISGPIPPKVIERHRKVVKNDTIFICASAKALLEEIPSSRKNFFLSPNAASPEHWNKKLDKWEENPFCETISNIRLQGKPIVGYHGALARWIDYDLLKKIAQQDQFCLLLIGVEYDNSLAESGLLGFKNVFYLGPIHYNVLPFIARFYDVSIIPFKSSELADGVSPIKLFEYMAIGKPIVVTSNSELKQYKSCLQANNQEDFLVKIYQALSLTHESSYLSLLRKEAYLNSWEKRCNEILSFCKVKKLKEPTR